MVQSIVIITTIGCSDTNHGYCFFAIVPFLLTVFDEVVATHTITVVCIHGSASITRSSSNVGSAAVVPCDASLPVPFLASLRVVYGLEQKRGRRVTTVARSGISIRGWMARR